jgi:hypothetical protein
VFEPHVCMYGSSRVRPGCGSRCGLGQAVLSRLHLHLPCSIVNNTKLAAACLALIAWWALVSFVPFVSRATGAPITLQVEASNELPGFSRTNLSHYLASHMGEANFADWRFEVAEDGPAPDRVEWSFKRNPYAGGEVRRFGPEGRSFHVRRPITIEARLYLNGEYQVTVEKQAVIDERSGRNDPHLPEAVASVTQNLLGPSGAYHAGQLGQRPASRTR